MRSYPMDSARGNAPLSMRPGGAHEAGQSDGDHGNSHDDHGWQTVSFLGADHCHPMVSCAQIATATDRKIEIEVPKAANGPTPVLGRIERTTRQPSMLALASASYPHRSILRPNECGCSSARQPGTQRTPRRSDHASPSDTRKAAKRPSRIGLARVHAAPQVPARRHRLRPTSAIFRQTAQMDPQCLSTDSGQSARASTVVALDGFSMRPGPRGDSAPRRAFPVQYEPRRSAWMSLVNAYPLLGPFGKAGENERRRSGVAPRIP